MFFMYILIFYLIKMITSLANIFEIRMNFALTLRLVLMSNVKLSLNCNW